MTTEAARSINAILSLKDGHVRPGPFMQKLLAAITAMLQQQGNPLPFETVVTLALGMLNVDEETVAREAQELLTDAGARVAPFTAPPSQLTH